MGVSTMRGLWFIIGIVGVAVILPGTYGVEPRDYEEALKPDEPLGSQAHETSTEYPNGVNVIPGQADIHYPILTRIPKSSFSCVGRIPGFYADTDLRCQVWHICDEGGIQQSFLCTNGTIYSQDKRVCDWWYNVNCDPHEVARNYEANKELYKEQPRNHKHHETITNTLPPPPPKKLSAPAPQPHPQQQRVQNGPQPQPTQQYRHQPQQEQRQRQPPQTQQRFHQPQQQASSNNFDEEQALRRLPPPPPPSAPQQQNFVSPSQSQYAGVLAPPPTPEKKRVIVLKLPGPLPPGATIPPQLLMDYAESVLAAERAGKPPPPGLISHKTVPVASGQPQRAPQPAPIPQADQVPQQQPSSAPPRPVPRGPILPYTPRPFSVFLEDAARFNAQTKMQLQQVPVPQPQPQPRPQNVEQRPQAQVSQRPPQYRPELGPTPSQPQVYRAQTQTIQQNFRQQPQQNFEQTQRRQPQQSFEQPSSRPQPSPTVQQNQPAYEQPRHDQNYQRQASTTYKAEQPTRPPPPPPVPQKKPISHPPKPKPVANSPPSDFKKFRHSTPRKYADVNFAPKSAVALEDLEDPEESRRPAYFNNLQSVPHLSQDIRSATTNQPKTKVHLKQSFEKIRVRGPEPTLKTLDVPVDLQDKDPDPSSEEQAHSDNAYEATKITVKSVDNDITVTTQQPPEIKQKALTRRIVRKKVRKIQTNPKPPTTSEPVTKSTTVRTTSTTTTTPFYQTDEDYIEPTRATKDFGFDVYGRTDEDDEEELELAAQEYYKASEHFGKRQRY